MIPKQYIYNSINIWIGKNAYSDVHFHFTRSAYKIDYPFDVFLLKFHNNIMNELKFPALTDFYFHYTKDDINMQLDPKYDNADILLINSIPSSGQLDGYAINWPDIANRLSSKYKIVTTLKLDNYLCTMDDNLTLKQIGALSSRVKYIIGVNTAVIIPCLNKYTLQNIIKIYSYDVQVYYKGDKFVHNAPVEQIYKDLSI
jgi:hypothetical protein